MNEDAQAGPAGERNRVGGLGHPAVRLTLILVVATVVFILGRYYLKPYSDPLNWLTLSQNLGTTEWLSRFPIGYALFLHLIRPLAGHYGIFLSNLAVLVVLFVLAGLLARRAAAEPPGSAATAAWALPAAFALLLYFDPRLLIYLTNPYRDPLSYTLIAGSMLLFLRATRPGGAPDAVLAAAGALLGFAACVRETSVIVAPWMALYGFLAARRDPRLAFGRSVFVFGLFFVVGVMPLMLQSMLRTGQMFVPPQIAVEGHLPGLHLVAFPLTAPKAASYLAQSFGVAGLGGLALGVVFAIRRRNPVILALLLPAALSHVLLYSFYYTMVRRYLFSVPVLVTPVIAYGWIMGAEALASWARKRGGRSMPLPAVAAVGLAVLACAVAFSIPTRPQFHIRQAKRLERDLRALVPTNTTVLAERHLCEILSYCGGFPSEPAPRRRTGDTSNEMALWLGVEPFVRSTRAMWFADLAPEERPGATIVVARRILTLDTVGSLRTADYRMTAEFGRGHILFHRARMWSACSTREAVPPAPAAEGVLCVDAGSLWDGRFPGRTKARLLLDGREIAARIGDGANYVPVTGLTPGRGGELTLESDAPVPDALHPSWTAPGGILLLNFAENARHWQARRLVRGFVYRGHEFLGHAECSGPAEVELPAPRLAGTECVADLMFESEQPDGEVPPLRIEARAGSARTVLKLPSKFKRTLRIPLEPDGSNAYRRVALNLTRDPADHSKPGEGGLARLSSARVHLLNREAGLKIDVGAEGDGMFLDEGFHQAEAGADGATHRWTDGDGHVHLPASWSATNLTVRMTYEVPGLTPAKANVRLLFNGVPVELRRTPGKTPPCETAEGRLPDMPASPSNTLRIVSEPWKARDFNLGSDDRRLGIYLDRLEIVPAGRP